MITTLGRANSGLFRRTGAALIAFTVATSGLLIVATPALAVPPLTVPMGTLTNFSALAHTTITDTGSLSAFADGVGVSPGTAITTITDGQVHSGGIHRNDSPAQQAQTDLAAAYEYAKAQTGAGIAAELGSQTLHPGVHSAGATALGLTGTLTLDGDGNPNSVFIIQTLGAFTAAASAQVVLTDSALECNVFFQVEGAVTLGANAVFRGNILSAGAVTVGASADFHGRALTTLGDMTLSTNDFFEPTCADPAGVTVSSITGPTTEAATTATFTVVLDTQPTADVTIAVSSSDSSEGATSTSLLTFTSANWATAQTVTVTGVDDFLDDGDVSYTIILATAAGGDYVGIDPTDVAVTNNDNDTVGVTVGSISGPTSEAATTSTFTVVLNSQPSTATVTVGVSSSDTTEGTVSTSLLTFTSANWATAQTVTVTGVDDLITDGNVAYTILLATAVGGDYAGIDPTDVAVTNNDNDTVGVTVGSISGQTTESGGAATFAVVLNTQPNSEVTIAVSSSDNTEGTVSTNLLTFTTTNWNTPQTVNVTGVDDSVDDGNIAYTILLAAAAGGDYTGINPADVAVSNTDNDTVGVTVGSISGPTTEAATTSTFTVVLNSEPSVATVTIAVSSSDSSEGTTSTSLLTFTSANWATAQTVTVTGVNDFVVDGTVGYSIALATASGGDYAGIDPADVAVSNTDNDTLGVTVGAVSGPTTEAATASTFTVVLNSEPSMTVTIGVSSSDPTEGTVSTSQLTFTTANWATAQTVTVTGVNDSLDDGDVAYAVILDPAAGGDYGGIDPTNISLTNTDDDTTIITPGGGDGGGSIVPAATGLVDTSDACPNSIASSGFGDLADLDVTTIQAIDCIVAYGISNGTPAETFTPTGTVPRWQMALFLIRHLQANGMLLPTPIDQEFNDIAGFDQETRDAINQLAQLGITQGTGIGAFSPNSPVSRWEMALFLVRSVAVVGTSLPTPAPTGFTDMTSMSTETTNAIDQLVSLGIAEGTSATTYEPANSVLRWQMALFLTRMLAVDGLVPN